jgi:hypothetical protein
MGQTAEFYIEEPTFKSPKVVEGTNVTHDFLFKNTGNTPLIISNYKVACSCTSISYPDTLAPNQSGIIKLTFDTNGKYYQQDRSIFLFTNTKKKQETLRFKVYVIPKDEQ